VCVRVEMCARKCVCACVHVLYGDGDPKIFRNVYMELPMRPKFYLKPVEQTLYSGIVTIKKARSLCKKQLLQKSEF